MTAVLERLAAAWALAGGVLLLVITLVTTANTGAFILDRFADTTGLAVTGLPGYEDFVRLLVSAAALMFFPYCQVRRGHIAVDLFVGMLPAAARRGLDRLWLAATAGAALCLCGWMGLGLLETRRDGTATTILGWLEWPFYLPGVLSLLLWAVIAAHQCIVGHEEDGHGA